MSDPLKKLDPFLAIAEGEIDLLLLEELHVSPSFRTWIVRSLSRDELADGEFVGAWRWVSNNLGESDLVLAFRTPGSDRTTAFLIENKIRAEFQERQPERYRERGVKGRNEGWWDDFRTCLVAPKQYLETTENAEFDLRLSYEAIAEWFASQEADPRCAFKARILSKAIESPAWQRIPDETVTVFFQEYEDICLRDFPQLELKRKPERSAQDYWVYFRQARGLPKDVYIIHKCEKGFVDLTFSHRDSAELTSACEGHLDMDMKVVQTEKSAALRLEVPPLDHLAPFETQADSARAGLIAAERLRAFCQANLSRLSDWPRPPRVHSA